MIERRTSRPTMATPAHPKRRRFKSRAGFGIVGE